MNIIMQVVNPDPEVRV